LIYKLCDACNSIVHVRQRQSVFLVIIFLLFL